MGLNLFKKRVRLGLPSTGFIVLIFASTIASILFAFRLHLASQEITRMNDGLKKEIAIIPFSKEVTAPATYTDPPPTDINQGEIWGVSEQISDKTWTMKVGQDEKMSTPDELLEALNAYRNEKGVGNLSWDEKLAELARMRAEHFYEEGTLDEHEGFRSYVEQSGKMEELGFWGVGENSSIGFQLEGVHLIEWIFAGDPPHENNQLDPAWTHVGIGIKGTAVDLVFGKR